MEMKFIENGKGFGSTLHYIVANDVTFYYGKKIERKQITGHIIVTIRNNGFAYLENIESGDLSIIYEVCNARLFIIRKEGKLIERVYVQDNGIMIEEHKGE